MKNIKKSEALITYKILDIDFKCREFQFESGKEFKHSGNIEICKSGFHSCKNPYDCENYYEIVNTRFAKCSVWGNIIMHEEDSKICSEFIEITELSLSEWNKACIDFLIEECKMETKENASSGDSAKNASSGDSAKNASSGDSAKNASSGDSAQNSSSGGWTDWDVKGKDSVTAAIGKNSKIKAPIGAWITLAEYDSRNKCVCVRSAKIDGEDLKSNTWYKLENGKFISP